MAMLVIVHGLETLEIQAIFDAARHKRSANRAWSAKKPRFHVDFAALGRERLPMLCRLLGHAHAKSWIPSFIHRYSIGDPPSHCWRHKQHVSSKMDKGKEERGLYA